MLDYAVKKRIISYNPCDLVTLDKSNNSGNAMRKENSQKTYEPKDCALLFQLLENEHIVYRIVIKFLVCTGVRRGEAANLRHRDIDLTQGTVNISGSIRRIRGIGVVENSPKTSHSYRNLNLINLIIDELKEYEAWKKELYDKIGRSCGPDDKFFVNTYGNPWTPDSITNFWNKINKKYEKELPYIRLHDLRHTYASLLVANNVEIPVVQSNLGHSRASTTENFYLHSLDSGKKRATEKIGRVFSEINQKAKGENKGKDSA